MPLAAPPPPLTRFFSLPLKSLMDSRLRLIVLTRPFLPAFLLVLLVANDFSFYACQEIIAPTFQIKVRWKTSPVLPAKMIAGRL
jgi:hypothetical protein